eukprot:scaffold29919_cov70-Cyclotella_meneghiniana.AAC.14
MVRSTMDDHIIIARRCMEHFLAEMKRCHVEGSTNEERLVIANEHLSRLNQLPSNSPLLKKVKELMKSVIDGQSRSLDTFVYDQVGDSQSSGIEWVCSICGKRNRATKKKYIECDTCGRPKDCLVSKTITQLSQYPIDPTPHLTNATKDEIQMIKPGNYRSEKWIGEEGKKSVFISKQTDYVALERTSIKSEIAHVLSSIRQSLGEE